MAIRVALHHVTHYRYDRPVQLLAARGAAAPGAALPHADRGLLAEGHARPSTSSTGSRIRSATTRRAWSSPSRRSELQGRGRPGRRPDHHQSVRLLPRGVRREVPVRLRARRCCDELRPYLERAPTAAPRFAQLRRPRARRHRAARAAHHRRAGRHQPAGAALAALRHPHGAGRVHARGDADARPRLVPRLRLAAGATCCATSASRRASCRATRSSSRRPEAARGPGGRVARTSPICTPGPRCTCPAPAGSASTPPAA